MLLLFTFVGAKLPLALIIAPQSVTTAERLVSLVGYAIDKVSKICWAIVVVDYKILGKELEK